MAQTRKISKNNTQTCVLAVLGIKVCTLYSTAIVTLNEHGRKVILNTGGYFTATTRTRMTQCFHEWNIPLSVGFTKKDGNRVRNHETGQEYEFDNKNTCVVTY